LGRTLPAPRRNHFLGNLGIKVFHQQNDIETSTYASDQIGSEYSFLSSFSASSGVERSNSSVGGAQHLKRLIEPIALTRLLKPTGANPYAQAIVYQSGKTFNASKTERNPEGSNYLSVFFSRE
jgi:hypothetical protein